MGRMHTLKTILLLLLAFILCGADPTWALDDSAGASAIGTVSLDDLPPEVSETLYLIERGGPFPYQRDGIEFQNREQLLPLQPRGYYHEYTVPTPGDSTGDSTRGDRRIISGQTNEYYYTPDHYRSFQRILQ